MAQQHLPEEAPKKRRAKALDIGCGLLLAAWFEGAFQSRSSGFLKYRGVPSFRKNSGPRAEGESRIPLAGVDLC